MSTLITPFNPQASTSGIIQTNGVNANEQLMLYNDSPVGLRLTFPDGSTDILPPGWNKDFILKSVAMSKVTWVQYNSIVATGYPASQVYGTIYEPDEHVASINASMQRGFTLTGGSASLSSSVGNIVNDGNPSGTFIIEVTVSGAPGSSIVLKSDGTITLAELIANVVTPFLQSFPGTATILKLGESGKTVEVVGTLTVDSTILANGGVNTNTIRDDVNGNVAADLSAGTGDINFKQQVIIENQKNVLGKDTGGTARIILFIGAGSDTILRACGVGSQILLQTQDGTNQGTVNANGFTIPKANSHGFTWFNGNFIPEISFFTGTGSGTYNHGWNGSGETGVPFWIAPIVTVAGSATQGYDSVTSTQVHVTLGAALAFKAFAV